MSFIGCLLAGVIRSKLISVQLDQTVYAYFPVLQQGLLKGLQPPQIVNHEASILTLPSIYAWCVAQWLTEVLSYLACRIPLYHR